MKVRTDIAQCGRTKKNLSIQKIVRENRLRSNLATIHLRRFHVLFALVRVNFRIFHSVDRREIVVEAVYYMYEL